jgi:hypothetical protein
MMKKQLLFFVVSFGILHTTHVSAWFFSRKKTEPSMRFQESPTVSNQEFLYQQLNLKRRDLDTVRKRKAYFAKMQQIDEINKEQQQEQALLQQITQLEAALRRAGAPL